MGKNIPLCHTQGYNHIHYPPVAHTGVNSSCPDVQLAWGWSQKPLSRKLSIKEGGWYPSASFQPPPPPTHPSPINHHQTAVKYIFNCQITYTCPGFAVKIFDNCLCKKIVKNLIVSLISFSDFLAFMFLFGVFSKCILRPQLLLAKVAL